MRHIFFCAAIAIVAVSSTALSAAQNRGPVGQYAAYTLPAGYEVDGNNYPCTNASCDSCGNDCGYESSCACETNCGCGCGFDWRERAATSGFIAGFEFLWLKPYFSDSSNYLQYTSILGDGVSSAQEYGLSTDYELAPRVWIGYQLCSGLSARIRYWQFDQQIANRTLQSTDEISYVAYSWWGEVYTGNGGILEIKNSLDVDVIDFDVMQDFNWCHTRLSLGGGISYAGLRMDRSTLSTSPVINGNDFISFSADRTVNRFEGIGPTLTAELKRQIFESGFSLVGGVRGTALFGRQKIQYDYESELIEFENDYSYGKSSNVCRSIFAGWIGVQYDREILNGTDVFARLSWEGQYWNGFGSPMDVDSDLAFEGLGIAFGIRR